MTFIQACNNDKIEIEECGICYEKQTLSTSLGCSVCKKRNHVACMEQILDSSNSLDCPFFRNNQWGRFYIGMKRIFQKRFKISIFMLFPCETALDEVVQYYVLFWCQEEKK